MKILITGGSRGIGFAVAKGLATPANRLFIVGRDLKSLETARDTLGNNTLTYSVDLENENASSLIVKEAEEKDFSPDVLILNAGAFSDHNRSVTQNDISEFRRVLQVNLLFNYEIVQRFLPILQKSSYPRIIIIGSTAALRSDSSLYGISKAALGNYARGLREELKHLGIGVTILHPGGTFTERRTPNEKTVTDRLLESDDIAKLIQTLFSLSRQAVVEEIVVRPMLGDTF